MQEMGYSEEEIIAMRELAGYARAAVENGVINRAFLDCEAALTSGLRNVQLTDHDAITALVAQLQVIDAVKTQILSYIDTYEAAKDLAEQGDK